MVGKIKEETWSLVSADIIALGALDDTDGPNRWDGTANKFVDIWAYQVPTGQAHILRPEHHFCAYIEDASTQVGDGTCRIAIEVRDPSQGDAKTIYGPALYVASKEFQDRDKMAHLDLRADYPVEEKFWIVIVVRDDATIDESDSYFKLETIRIRPTI